jgi:hypothetical protein
MAMHGHTLIWTKNPIGAPHRRTVLFSAPGYDVCTKINPKNNFSFDFSHFGHVSDKSHLRLVFLTSYWAKVYARPRISFLDKKLDNLDSFFTRSPPLLKKRDTSPSPRTKSRHHYSKNHTCLSTCHGCISLLLQSQTTTITLYWTSDPQKYLSTRRRLSTPKAYLNNYECFDSLSETSLYSRYMKTLSQGYPTTLLSLSYYTNIRIEG